MTPHAVIDSSVAIKWVLTEEGSDHARALAGSLLEAPDLLLTECANILWKKVRIGNLTPSEILPRWQMLLLAPIQFAPTRDVLDEALQIAVDLEHPVYDCTYVALAFLRGVPLITADQKLAAAVRKRKALGVRVNILGQSPH